MSDAPSGWSTSGSSTQPPYGQSPPQPRRSRDGLIIGGVIAGTLVFLLGIGAVVYVRAGAGDPTAPQESASPEPWFDESVLNREEPRYAWADNLCGTIDFEPLLAMVPDDDGPTEQRGGVGSSTYQECRFDLTDGESVGQAGVHVLFAPHADSARVDFDFGPRRLDTVENRTDIEGWWQRGYRYSDTTSDTAVELLIRDDNLVVALWLVIGGDGGDLPAQEAALVAVSESVRDVLRA